MKHFCAFLILFFLILISFQNVGYSQKANVEKLYDLWIDGKYEEAYRLSNSKSFKFKEEDAEEYFYLHSMTCKSLYQTNPEINSTFRNEAIRFASRLLSSKDFVRVNQGAYVVNFLTHTIFLDVIDNIKPKSDSDSILLNDFTTETIEAFELFTVPKDLNDSTLYFIGSSFYNDGVFIMTEMITSDDDIEIITDRTNRSVALFKIAGLFFEALCANYNLRCDTHKMISVLLGKTE